MNWLDTTRRDRFGFEMVDPHDLTSSRGWMSGYMSGGISEGYYTDVRNSANLDFVDSGYIRGSLIRIHHYVDAEGYHDVLGTFFVTDRVTSEHDGKVWETFTCSGMLQRALSHMTNRVLTFSNQTAISAWDAVCRYLGIDYIVDGATPDSRISSPISWDVGEGYMEVLNDLADAMGARFDMRGDGTVVLSPYIAPSQKTAMFELTDLMVEGEITTNDGSYGQVNQVIVSATDGDTVISGDAWLPSSDPASIEQTGYAVSEHVVMDDLSPMSKIGAQRAAQGLIGLYDGGLQRSMRTVYLPIRCGDVLSYKDSNVMLQSRDINLSPGMVCECVFREV